MIRALALAAALLPLVAVETAARPTLPRETATLQALDKITARISEIEAPVDRPVRFKALEIVVRACRVTPPTEAPESAAFLQVDEVKPESGEERVFSGWMFASSPGLSAMDHPVYDVWVLGCGG